MKHFELEEHVADSLQLALLLEVSASPKPGNIHRNADFHETHYEHFLASAVAVSSAFHIAARKGIEISKGKIEPSQAKLGNIIRNAVENIKKWQTGGNTSLGTIILLTPMAVAASTMFAKEERFSVTSLRHYLKLVVESTTPQDAIAVYDAIKIANPSGLGKAPKLDVYDHASKRTILAEKTTLYEVFKVAAPYDSVCSEWTYNYAITFNIGYPYFQEQLEEGNDLNTAVVHTFLKILSEVPDTLIARKTSLEKAKKVSLRAKEILGASGLRKPEGRRKLQKFDKELRDEDHKLNPGTTADIVAAVIAAGILNGYKP